MADETPVVVPAEAPAEPQVPEPTPEPAEPEEPAAPTEPAPAPEPEDEEPPVRTDWRAEYFKEKNRNKPPEPQAPQQPPAPAQPSDDIRKAIREELAPIAQSFAKSKDEEELQSAFAKYPDAKKIE